MQSNLHFLKQQLSSARIELILEQIKSPEYAKLIGILSHFVYWAVFGGFNELFLDNYHKKSLLITLLQQLQTVEEKIIESLIEGDNHVRNQNKEKVDLYVRPTEPAQPKRKKIQSQKQVTKALQVKEMKKLFNNFIMPFMLMVIRFQIE